MFPQLSRMACNYLSIPGEWLIFLHVISGAESVCLIATSVDVECIFSRSRLILPHVRGHLAVQSTCASLYVGLWSSEGLVRDGDIKAALGAGEVDGEEDELATNWDSIHAL
jgi:hypothetical protein